MINKDNKRKLKTSVGPTDRKRANLEAEKGETVLTNLSEGNNIYELKKIGGKKHSKGGTPLDLPAGENPGEGSSFIFSDNKKLMMKDKDELAFFGIKGSKGMTPAEISSKHIDAIAKSKAIILDKYSDKISKKAAEMNLDNSRFALSALALWQESKKGMKDGASDQFAPFFDKTQTSPEDIFGMNPNEQQALGQQMQAAFGGQLQTFSKGGSVNGLPKFVNAGDTEKVTVRNYKESELPKDATFGKPGSAKVGDFIKQDDGTYKKVTYINTSYKGRTTKTQDLKLDEWLKQSPENKEKYDLALAAFNRGITNKQIIKNEKTGKYDIRGNFDASFEEKVAMSDVINLSGDNFLLGDFKIGTQNSTKGYGDTKSGSFVGGFTPEDYEKRYFLEKLKAEGLSEKDAFAQIDAIYADATKKKEARTEFLKFAGLTPTGSDDILSEDFYKKNYKDLTYALENKYRTDKEYRPKMGDDKWSGFEHFDAYSFNPEYDFEAIPKDAPVSEYDKGKGAEHLGNMTPAQEPFDFRKEDINALNRAINAKHSIRKYDPWSKAAQFEKPDVMFYSPERQIAAVNEQLAQGIQGVNAFATPGQAASAASEMQGNAYAQVADVIGNYDDKNVGLFNDASRYNTQLANAQHAQDAQQATNMYDKRVVLKQQFDNSLNAAKDKITQLSNQAWTNAANIHNLNTMTENFKKDPYTGLITKVKDKDIIALDEDAKLYDHYSDFHKKMKALDPNFTNDQIIRLYAGTKKPEIDATDATDTNI